MAHHRGGKETKTERRPSPAEQNAKRRISQPPHLYIIYTKLSYNIKANFNFCRRVNMTIEVLP